MNQTALYEETSITTQDRGRLIVLLYEGTIKFLKKAIYSIESNNMQKKGYYICKAQDIIFELNTVLKMEEGGEITSNLRKLYNFMWDHLSKANSRCDSKMIREVIGILDELLQGWKAVSV